MQPSKVLSDKVISALRDGQKRGFVKPASIGDTAIVLSFLSGSADAETTYTTLIDLGYTDEEILSYAESIGK